MANEDTLIPLYLKGDSSEQQIGSGAVKTNGLSRGVFVYVHLLEEFNTSGMFTHLSQTPLELKEAPVLLRLVLRDTKTGDPITSIEGLRAADSWEKAKQDDN